MMDEMKIWTMDKIASKTTYLDAFKIITPRIYIVRFYGA